MYSIRICKGPLEVLGGGVLAGRWWEDLASCAFRVGLPSSIFCMNLSSVCVSSWFDMCMLAYIHLFTCGDCTQSELAACCASLCLCSRISYGCFRDIPEMLCSQPSQQGVAAALEPCSDQSSLENSSVQTLCEVPSCTRSPHNSKSSFRKKGPTKDCSGSTAGYVPLYSL